MQTALTFSLVEILILVLLVPLRAQHYYGLNNLITTIKHENSSHHLDRVTFLLPIKGEELVLDLTLNKKLIPKRFFRKTSNETVFLKPDDIHLCHYSGKVRNRPGSWVSLSTCHGISGVVYDGKKTHNIDGSNVYFLHSKRHKRTVEESYKKQRYIELVLVVDNSKYNELGKNIEKVSNYCKDIVNIVNGLYSSLYIHIALVGIVIWTNHDEIQLSSNNTIT